jgi:hypothetical protein
MAGRGVKKRELALKIALGGALLRLRCRGQKTGMGKPHSGLRVGTGVGLALQCGSELGDSSRPAAPDFNTIQVTSAGAPKRMGGPQYPVPLLT